MDLRTKGKENYFLKEKWKVINSSIHIYIYFLQRIWQSLSGVNRYNAIFHIDQVTQCLSGLAGDSRGPHFHHY